MPLVASRSFAPKGMPWSGAAIISGADFLFRLLRKLQSVPGGDSGDRAELGAELFEAREIGFRQFNRADLARFDLRPQVADTHVQNLVLKASSYLSRRAARRGTNVENESRLKIVR